MDSSGVTTTPTYQLNPRVKSLRPSATLAMNERSAQLAREGREIYKLGFGQSPFPVPAPVVAALQANAFQKDYLPVKGLPALRVAVAEFHRRWHDLPATAEDILIGPGSKELLFLAQLVYQADLILPAPSWVSYEPQARLLGLDTHWVPTRGEDGWRLTPEGLEQACQGVETRPRMLILNYPNNPTGLSYDAAQLEALAQVARRHRLLIVADEIYGELHHEGAHVSIARFYPEGVIVSGGLSKWCGAGGWRLGTFCFPANLRWLLDAMACVASETFSCVASPVQHAAVTAFERDQTIERYLKQSRRILRALGRIVSQRLRTAGVNAPAPDGGFYLYPDFTPHAERLRARGLTTSAALCERLLDDTGVALLPGSDFGRPATELACRLAYVDFAGAECLLAAERIPLEEELSEQFLIEHCGRVLTAIDLLGEWL
ncbi:MAG: pyridoxal phosphate-dependent aminotransferase [Blastocatellales bacterium]